MTILAYAIGLRSLKTGGLIDPQVGDLFYPDERADANRQIKALQANANPGEEFFLRSLDETSELPADFKPNHRLVAGLPTHKERQPITGLTVAELQMIVQALEATSPVASFDLREKLQKELAERRREELRWAYAEAGGPLTELAPSAELREIEKRKKKLKTLAAVRNAGTDGEALLAALGLKKESADAQP